MNDYPKYHAVLSSGSLQPDSSSGSFCIDLTNEQGASQSSRLLVVSNKKASSNLRQVGFNALLSWFEKVEPGHQFFSESASSSFFCGQGELRR